MCGSSKVIKMVPFHRRHNLLFFVPAEVYAYIEPFRGPWVAGMHSIQRHVVKIWSATHRTRPRGTSRVCADRLDSECYAKTPLVRFVELSCPKQIS